MAAIEPFDLRELHGVPDWMRRRLRAIKHFRDRPRNLGDIDIAVAVNGYPMWRHQLIRRFALAIVAKLGQQSAVKAIYANARTHGLCTVPGGPEAVRAHAGPPGRAEFANVAKLFGTSRVDTKPARQCHPSPYGFELAIGGEDLHPGVMAVGDVNISVAVRADVVRQVELAGFVARLTHE
jgi:hypothetical protein